MFILIVRDKFLHLFLLPFLFERCEDRFFLGPPQLVTADHVNDTITYTTILPI